MATPSPKRRASPAQPSPLVRVGEAQVGGARAAPSRGAVHHVVVEQREGVEELEGGPGVDGAIVTLDAARARRSPSSRTQAGAACLPRPGAARARRAARPGPGPARSSGPARRRPRPPAAARRGRRSPAAMAVRRAPRKARRRRRGSPDRSPGPVGRWSARGGTPGAPTGAPRARCSRRTTLDRTDHVTVLAAALRPRPAPGGTKPGNAIDGGWRVLARWSSSRR